jgi:hypothetical protein
LGRRRFFKMEKIGRCEISEILKTVDDLVEKFVNLPNDQTKGINLFSSS